MPQVDFHLDLSADQKDRDRQDPATEVNLVIVHANAATDHVVAVVTALEIAVQPRVTMKGMGLAFNITYIRVSHDYIRFVLTQTKSRNEESNTLAIFNLYYKTDQDELRRIFERYGKIEVKFGLFEPRTASGKFLQIPL